MAPTATKALTRELGTANPALSTTRGLSWARIEGEHSADWQWPSYVHLVQRLRKDSRLSSVRRLLCAPVLDAGRFRLDDTGVRPEVTALVSRSLGLDRVGQPRTGRKGVDWSLYLRHALLGLDFGHMIFEQVADYADGEYVLAKLAPRMPATISKWQIAPDGGLAAVEQRAPAVSGGTVRLGVERLVVHVWPFVEAANWLGTSIYREAFKHWLMRDMLYELDGQKADRNAIGVPVATVSSGTSMEVVEAALRNFRAGSESHLALPEGTEFQLVGTTGSTHDLLASITHHGHEMAMALLAHVLTLGHDNGARSLGDTFAEVLATAQNEVAHWLAETITEHVIADVVAWNWGLDEPYPTLTHTRIAPSQAATPDAIKALSDAGIVVADDALEAWARDLIHAPAPDPATARPRVAPQPTAQPAQAKRKPRAAEVPHLHDLAVRAQAVVEQLSILPG